MSLRAWQALIYWLLVLGLLLAAAELGVRNGVATLPDVLSLLALMGFATVGALLVARRPGNLIGWIFCADALLHAVSAVAQEAVQFSLARQPGVPAPAWWPAVAAILPGPEWLAWIYVWIGDSGWVLLFTFTFLLFPTGRLPSRRWRPLAWLIVALLLFHSFVATFRPGPFEEFPALTNPLAQPLAPWLMDLDAFLGTTLVVPVLACLASLFFRYRAASGEERQQIKWIVFVAAALTVVIVGVTVADAAGQRAAVALFDALFPLGLLALPVAVGISILRHRLWDIDVLIRRTLVYGVLSVALVMMYLGSTVLLQQLFRAVSRQESQLVIVLSTLAIAAAFAPLRRRIQSGIDRRFYRGKVDAAQTLAAFSTSARDEVDLEALRRSLLESVGGAFEPEHVSLWLPAAEGKKG